MKNTLKYALAATLGLAVMAPAFAQNFPDVPENHWAFEALDNLKREGILVGYPDGLYRGTRFATRYEMAIAIHAAYKKLMGMTSGLSEQIKALEEAVNGNTGGDLKGIRDQLAALQAQVDGMKNFSDDAAALRKLADTFEKELASLGVDVEGLKKDMADLEKRVSDLEKRKAVEIGGDANLLVLAGHSRDRTFGMGKDGRVWGANDAGTAPVGLTKDLNVYHEVAVTLKKGANVEGPDWKATIVYGNLLTPGGFGDQSNFMPGTTFADTGNGDIYIQDLGVTFDTSLIGLGFKASVGRIPVSVSPYMFQRTDTTPYFKNDRWDDGQYRMDGATLDFKFGGVGLTVLGGRNANRNSSNGTDINPIFAPFGPAGTKIDSTLGAKISVPIGTLGTVNGAYLFHDTDATVGAGSADRLNVFGGDANFKFGALTLNGGYSKSIQSRNTSSVPGGDTRNQAAFVTAGFKLNNTIDLRGGYRHIQENYIAAGDWGRIGTAWSPNNIKTFQAGITANLGGFLLGYDGEFGETIVGAADIESHRATVGYQLNTAWKATASYEDVKIKFTPNTRQKWAGINLDYNLASNSMVSLGYEYGSVSGSAWGLYNPAGYGSYRGGLLTTQLSIKF